MKLLESVKLEVWMAEQFRVAEYLSVMYSDIVT
jgi:hypothetical protein